MSVQNWGPPKSEWELLSQKQSVPAHAAQLAEIVFEIKKRKKLRVKKGQIEKIAQGLSEIAYSLGQTNDTDSFATELTSDIMEALVQASKRQKKKPAR